MTHFLRHGSRTNTDQWTPPVRFSGNFRLPSSRCLVGLVVCVCVVGCQTLQPRDQQATTNNPDVSKLSRAGKAFSTKEAWLHGTPTTEAKVVNKLLDHYATAPIPSAMPRLFGSDELSTGLFGQHLAYGFDLARRGSVLHARENFIESLRIVAHKHDAQAQGISHTQALNEALAALEEADQFAEEGLFSAKPQALKSIVAKHQTRVAKGELPENFSGLTLAQQYLAFAEQKFAEAAAGEPEASLALYALARSELVPRFGSVSPRQIRGAKAATFLQAALRVDANNAIALNELGVLMAKSGQLSWAEQLLQQSTKLAPSQEAWSNLASVYLRTGKQDLAAAASQQLVTWSSLSQNPVGDCRRPRKLAWSGSLRSDSKTLNRPFAKKWPVRWVSTKEFVDADFLPANTLHSHASPLQAFPRQTFLIQQVSHHENLSPTSHQETILSQLEPIPLPAVTSDMGNLKTTTELPIASELFFDGSRSCQEGCVPKPSARCGVACIGKDCCGRTLGRSWDCSQRIPWEVFAQGDYIGPARTPHLPVYRLRVDDQLEFVYRLTADATESLYRIRVGDVLRIESETREKINREVIVQPDGKVTIVTLGQVDAEGLTIDELRQTLETKLSEIFMRPSISVLPIKINSKIEELRASVDSRSGNGGQARKAKVTPEGTIQLPGIGSVPAQGLSLEELKIEIEIRHQKFGEGIEVTPVLIARAPRYLYVLGEAKVPGRYSLEGPTSLTQAIALAGGWNVGADLRRVVVLRRDQCWRLMATQACLHDALYGKNACPDDLWLRDSDVVIIPKRKSLVLNEAIELVFTRGIYGIVPFGAQYQFTNFRSF